MSRTSPAPIGPGRLGAQTRAAVRPTSAPAVTGGFWYDRLGVNARVGIPQGTRMLGSAGNLHNLRLVADKAECGFRGDYRFQDTDVYKWLEAASWQLAQDAVAGRDSAALNAEAIIDRHGHEAYCQDRVPPREAEPVEGHAVRQLYLLAAAADLATETGDESLAAAGARLGHAMAATKTHLTGGVGANHDKEDFGDPYRLPTERAYRETGAAIAPVPFGWRMALLTGQALEVPAVAPRAGLVAVHPHRLRAGPGPPWNRSPCRTTRGATAPPAACASRCPSPDPPPLSPLLENPP
jgi:Beta-L-arabinofuranosidase, GH127